MSKIHRSTGLTRFLVVTALGLVPIGFPLLTPSLCLAQDYGGQDPGELDMPNPFGQFPGDDDMMPRRGTRAKTARKKLQSATKGTAKKADATAKTKKGATKNDAGSTGQLKFSQDIAPILVANCIGCHSGDGAGLQKGKLDLTTFEKLKKGSQKRTDDPEIVIAGKPDESHLVLRIKGEETPRMPQGGNNRMSAEAIAKIEQWVKEGAKLDAGIDPKKPIKSYAASADQVARTRSPSCRRQSATRRPKPLASSAGSRPIPSSSPRLFAANISSCSATCPATGPRARSRSWKRSMAT